MPWSSTERAVKWLPGGYPQLKSATIVPESRRALSVRDRGVGGSNPLAPTIFRNLFASFCNEVKKARPWWARLLFLGAVLYTRRLLHGAVITRSIPALAIFLKDLAARSGPKPVQVVAQDVAKSALAAAWKRVSGEPLERV